MLYNFNKIDNSGKLSLFRKGTSNSIGLTDVKLPAANASMKMAQVNVATQQGAEDVVGSVAQMKINVNRLQLNKETISRLQPDRWDVAINDGSGNKCFSWYCLTKDMDGKKCDLPTIGHDDGDNCISKTDWGWCWCKGVGAA